MPRIERQFAPVDVIFGAANGPAAIKFLDSATKRLGDHLMTKADANHRTMRGIVLADELFERWYPVVILIGAVF